MIRRNNHERSQSIISMTGFMPNCPLNEVTGSLNGVSQASKITFCVLNSGTTNNQGENRRIVSFVYNVCTCCCLCGCLCGCLADKGGQEERGEAWALSGEAVRRGEAGEVEPSPEPAKNVFVQRKRICSNFIIYLFLLQTAVEERGCGGGFKGTNCHGRRNIRRTFSDIQLYIHAQKWLWTTIFDH